MDQTHLKKNSIQQSWTAVEVSNIGRTVLKDNNLLELLYQDKFNNIDSCTVEQSDAVNDYNKFIDANKDNFKKINPNIDETDRDEFDQRHREKWYMPDEYKTFDVEKFVLACCQTEQEVERVKYELELFKTYAMMDVLCFLKYLVDTLREKNIVWGVGRGSSVSSYVLFLLGVHKVNSIKFDLDPKEFLR